MKNNRGFTLIELLVVVAIIGLLASVVLASLNSARAKGADGAAKQDLTNIRSAAEVYYINNGNSYIGLCAGTSTIYPILVHAASVENVHLQSPTNMGGSLGHVECHESATAWAASVPLKNGVGQYFCVDSIGVTKQSSWHLEQSALKCFTAVPPAS